jgi:hypothetical protein
MDMESAPGNENGKIHDGHRGPPQHNIGPGRPHQSVKEPAIRAQSPLQHNDGLGRLHQSVKEPAIKAQSPPSAHHRTWSTSVSKGTSHQSTGASSAHHRIWSTSVSKRTTSVHRFPLRVAVMDSALLFTLCFAC